MNRTQFSIALSLKVFRIRCWDFQQCLLLRFNSFSSSAREHQGASVCRSIRSNLPVSSSHPSTTILLASRQGSAIPLWAANPRNAGSIFIHRMPHGISGILEYSSRRQCSFTRYR